MRDCLLSSNELCCAGLHHFKDLRVHIVVLSSLQQALCPACVHCLYTH